MVGLGGGLFLIVMFSVLFIAPLVLGAYVVVGGTSQRTMTTYFGIITALFVIVLVFGVLATLALPPETFSDLAETIEHLNRPPTITDKAGRLHRLRCKRHRFTISIQHMRQKLVRVWQGFAFGPIMHHEEPSAHFLFRSMHRIARDSLLNL